MEDSEIYTTLLEKYEDNKYRLIQIILEKGTKYAKTNMEFDPFHVGNFLTKVAKELLKEIEDKE